MKNLNIKTKLLVTLSVVIIISFFILGVNSINKEFEQQYNGIKKEELSLAKESSKYIDAFFKSKMSIVESYAKKLSLDDNAQDIIKNLDIGKNAGNFVDLYVGLEKNGYLFSPLDGVLTPQKDDYDPRTRDWYKDAVKFDKVGVSSPYVDNSTKKLVVSIFAPLKQGDKTVGVISSDIFIDTIVDTILKIKLKETGYAYLVNKNSQIFVHKDKNLLNKKDKLFGKIKMGENSSFKEENIDGVDLLTSYSLIPSVQWYLVTRLEKQEITAEIRNLIFNTIFIYVVLLIVILLIIYITLKKLLSPIEKLQDGLNFFFRYLNGQEKQIKSLNIKTNDEFGTMAKVLDEEMKAIEIAIYISTLVIFNPSSKRKK